MGKSRILIVDDNLQNLQFLGNMLVENQYEPVVAMGGVQAIEFLNHEKPDLILMDVMMPDLDGYEACQRIKLDKENKDIPIIFLTAKIEPEDVVKGFEMGGVDYVTKPFNVVELLARIKTHLEVKFSREQILKQSEERKQLIHILCHDLTNPFVSLISTFELISEDISFWEVVKEQINISIHNGLDVIDLVRDMLALEDGAFQIKLASCDLSSLLAESISILSHQAEAKKVQIEVMTDIDQQVLVEKRSFINSVLNNILTNAIKFSYPHSKIVVSAYEENDLVAITIKDSGIGMSKSLKNDIFDLSRFTSRSGTQGEKGTGFGMPLVKKMMLEYGGDIELASKEKTESSADHGTLVTLKLISAK